MSYYIVNLGMSLAMALFLAGYAFRRRNNRLHRALMLAAIATTTLTAAALLMAVHVLSGGDFRVAGFFPRAPHWVILAHRIAASVAFLLMFAMAWTGYRRIRLWHVRLHFVFFPLFVLVYISGLLIFEGTR